jgi:DNA-binding transcriptional ArsR family regulator
MVEEIARTNAIFHALSHEARRDMLTRLASGDLTISQLAKPLAMSFAASSKHVQVLERAGLLKRNVQGRRHICRLEPGPLATASRWLQFSERLAGERLEALEVFVKAKPKLLEEED